MFRRAAAGVILANFEAPPIISYDEYQAFTEKYTPRLQEVQQLGSPDLGVLTQIFDDMFQEAIENEENRSLAHVTLYKMFSSLERISKSRCPLQALFPSIYDKNLTISDIQRYTRIALTHLKTDHPIEYDNAVDRMLDQFNCEDQLKVTSLQRDNFFHLEHCQHKDSKADEKVEHCEVGGGLFFYYDSLKSRTLKGAALPGHEQKKPIYGIWLNKPDEGRDNRAGKYALERAAANCDSCAQITVRIPSRYLDSTVNAGEYTLRSEHFSDIQELTIVGDQLPQQGLEKMPSASQRMREHEFKYLKRRFPDSVEVIEKIEKSYNTMVPAPCFKP